MISQFSMEYFIKIAFFIVMFRYNDPFFGSTQFQWSFMGHGLCFLKVSVVVDYLDSVVDY
jgi:hypothetical protein